MFHRLDVIGIDLQRGVELFFRLTKVAVVQTGDTEKTSRIGVLRVFRNKPVKSSRRIFPIRRSKTLYPGIVLGREKAGVQFQRPGGP